MLAIVYIYNRWTKSEIKVTSRKQDKNCKHKLKPRYCAMFQYQGVCEWTACIQYRDGLASGSSGKNMIIQLESLLAYFHISFIATVRSFIHFWTITFIGDPLISKSYYSGAFWQMLHWFHSWAWQRATLLWPGDWS